jgi:hypothetical protein
MISVRFVRYSPPYNHDEVAGFEPVRAAELVARGDAVYLAPPADEASVLIDIPDDWAAQSAAQRVALAKLISGKTPKSADANAIIAAELERRSAVEAVDADDQDGDQTDADPDADSDTDAEAGDQAADDQEGA